jgi:hypothetical protein
MIFQYRDFLLDNSGLMNIGITIIVFVVLNLILALLMIIKGLRMKYYTMSLIGFVFLAGVSAWGGVVFNFLYIIIADDFPSWIWYAYFMIQGGLLFVFHYIWIIGMTKLTSIKKKTRITFLIIFGIFIALMEASWWLLIVINVDLLGDPRSFPFIVDYTPASYFYLTTSLAFFTIGGTWLVIESFRSSDPKVKLKAKFLLIWVILITLGSLSEIYDPIENILTHYYDMDPLDAAVWGSYINKIGLTIGVFSAYIGFTLPKFVERIFLKT